MLNPASPADIPQTITLSLLESKCTFFELTEYAIINKKQIAFEQYEFYFDVNFKIFEKEKLVRVEFNSRLSEKQDNNLKVELAKLNSLCVFSVINFEEIVKRDNNGNLLIPDLLMQICSGTTLAAASGMYNVKLENSLYSNSVLPLIDPKVLLPRKNLTP